MFGLIYRVLIRDSIRVFLRELSKCIYSEKNLSAPPLLQLKLQSLIIFLQRECSLLCIL
jgi:hypothetical protein